MVSVDVASDTYQAYTYYEQGHHYWSGSTLGLMFIPIVTCATIEILAYSVRRYQGNLNDWSWKASFKTVIRHFPLCQPFVHLSYLLTLKTAKDEVKKAQKFYKSFEPMEVNDTNRNHYRSEVEKAAAKYEKAHSNYAKALTDFQELKLSEAFGEAAPQAVLQFAIIMQLGYVSPIQLLTIATSLFSFSLASAEIFLMMKTKNNDMKEASWRQTFLMVIPAMFAVVVPRILSLSMITAYCKEFAMFFIAAYILFNVLCNIRHFKRDPSKVLMGAMTNVFAPCIVIDEGSGFFKRSAVTSSILHILGQIFLVILVILHVMVPCPDIRSYSPILHCYQAKDLNSTGMRCPVVLSERSCSADGLQVNYDELNCRTDIFPIAWSLEGNYITVCQGILWWAPMAIVSSILVFLHLIGSLIIINYLSKIIDPIGMLKTSRSGCCYLMNCFVPAWSEDQADLCKPIEDFLEAPSKSTMKGANVKLQELFKPQLVDLSIDLGYDEVIRILIDDLNVPVSLKMLERSFKNGNSKVTKMFLRKLKQFTIPGE